MVDGAGSKSVLGLAKRQGEDIFSFLSKHYGKLENRPKLVRHVTKKLKPKDWHRCPICNGTGSYETAGDLHRSAGIVPCYHCDHGTVKTITRAVYRVKAVGIKV